MESILNTIKKLLGILIEDTAFDEDVLLFINNAVAILRQLGVGPEEPLLVVDKDTEWSALTDNVTVLSMAKTYIHLTTKLAFDPPGNSFVTDSYNRQIQELVWRIETEANPYIPPVEEPSEV